MLPAVAMSERTEPTPIGSTRDRALVVEDSRTNKLIAVSMLGQLNFDVDYAENGVLALERLDSRPYDLVLMDIMMPRMDGYICTREIRRRFPWPRVPVIAVTANVMTGDRERCLEAGADDYLSKPYKLDELTAAVKRVRTSRSAAADPASSGGPIDTAWIESTEVFDGESVPALSIVDVFRDEARFTIEQIFSALVVDDARQLYRAARTLRSAAANVGALGLADQAAALERCGEHGNLDQASSMVDMLSGECDRVLSTLEYLETGYHQRAA